MPRGSREPISRATDAAAGRERSPGEGATVAERGRMGGSLLLGSIGTKNEVSNVLIGVEKQALRRERVSQLHRHAGVAASPSWRACEGSPPPLAQPAIPLATPLPGLARG